jgi:hypothetical protein
VGCLIVATALTATKSAAPVRRGTSLSSLSFPIEPLVRNAENGNTTLQENFSYPKLCYVRNDPGLAIDAETTDAQTPEECAAEIDEDGSPVNPIPATPGAPHLPLSQYAKAYPDRVKALGDAPGTLVVAGFMGDA